MSASVEEFQQLRAYMGSSRELTQWITGAKALALLGGAVESGVMDAPTDQEHRARDSGCHGHGQAAC
jgi:hypothetical protein